MPSSGKAKVLWAKPGGLSFWLLPLVIAVCGFVLVVTVKIYRDFGEYELAQVEGRLKSISALNASHLENWLRERQLDASILANDSQILRLTRDKMHGAPGSDAHRLLDQGLSIIMQSNVYAAIQIFDEDANLIYVSGEAQTQNHVERQLLASVMRTGQTGISGLHRDREDPVAPIMFDIIEPIPNQNGTAGVVYMHVNAQAVLFPMIQSWPFETASGESLLVKREGDEVIFMNSLRFRKDTALNLRLPLAETRLPAAMALRGVEGMIEGRDYRGIEVVAIAKKIAGTDWVLVSKMDRAEVFKPIHTLAMNIILVMALVGLFIGLLFYFWRKNLIIRQQLLLHQAEIKELALGRHLDYLSKHANDIILLTDDDGVIMEANDRAIKSYRYSRDELMGKNILEIDSAGAKINNDNTHSISQDGLLFETVHLRKDGSEFPVEVSLRTIKVGDQNYRQLIIRDISEHKKIYHSLQDAYRQTGEIIDTALDAFIRIDAEGRIGYWNRSAEKMFGWTVDEVAGRGIDEILIPPEYRQPYKQGLEHFLKTHESELLGKLLEVTALNRRGQSIPVEMSISPTKDEDGSWFFNAFIRDISQRKSILAEMNIYKHIVSFSTNLMAYVDKDFVFQAVNDALANYFETTKEQIIGHTVAELLGQRRFETSIKVQMQRCLDGESVIYDQEVDVPALGQRIHEAHFDPHLGEDGQASGIIINAMDITERRQLNEQLQLSEEKFKTITERSPVGMFLDDADGNTVYVNDRCGQLVGVPVEKSLNLDWSAFIHPDDRERVMTLWAESVKHGKSFAQEYRWLHPEGKVVWTRGEIVPVKDERGKVILFIGTLLDISEAKQAELALRQSEERFQLAVEATNAGVWDWDINTGKEWWSPRFYHLLGYFDGEVEASYCQFQQMLHPDERDTIIRANVLHREQHLPYDVQMRMQTKSGEYRWFRGRGQAQWNPQGEAVRMLGSIEDINDAKENERRLRDSQHRLRSFFDAGLIGMAMSSVDKKWLDVNDEFCRLTGYTQEELTTMSWLDMTHPDDVESNVKLFDQVVAGEIENYTLEKRFVRKDGTSVPTLVSVRAIRKADGSLDYFVTFAMDLSERKALEQREISLGKIIRHSMNETCINDAETMKFIEVNDGVLHHTGYSREELLKMTVMDLTPERSWAEVDNITRPLREGAENRVMFESVHQRKDGSRYPILVELQLFPYMGKPAYVAFAIDISDRKVLEQEQARTNRALRCLSMTNESLLQANSEMELVNAICQVIVEHGGYLFAWVGYAGHDPDKTVRPVAQHGDVEDFIDDLYISWDEAVPEGQGPAGKTIRTGTPVVIRDMPDSQVYVRRQEIVEKYGFSSGMTSVLDIDKTSKGVLGIYSKDNDSFSGEEIELLEKLAANLSYGIKTHRLNVEKIKIEKMLRQAQKMESIGQLSGGVAHDFNNLLGIIQGCLDILSHAVGTDRDLQDWVEKGLDAVRRGAVLTGKMLSFSQSRAIDAIPHDVNRMLADISELIKVTLTPAITFQLEITEDLWIAAFNADEFEDVILNLVLNARDAMPDGGNLLIETSNKVLDADYARRNPRLEAGDYVLISVSDNGTGMDEEVVTHLFDPFFTTKEVGKGSGLGLSMVYGFAQRSGGHIKVYTNPGHGSTFRLYLPRLIDADAIALTNKPAVVALPHGTETVLVVEDEAELREIARAHLQLLGYHVVSAENATVALQILQSRAAEIDLVFSDVVMPGGMGGFELAQEVKTRWPQIKVLMTSGFTDRATKSNGLAKLQTTLLEKPYSERELAIALRDLLNSKALQS